MSKVHSDVWLFRFRRWDINSSIFFASVIEGTEFPVKIDFFKSRFCTYWLKCGLAYFVMSSGRYHLSWSSWFKMLNLFKGCCFSYIFSDISLSLPCLRKLRAFFVSFFFFLLFRFLSPMELDEEEVLLEEVRVTFLLFCILLFILRTFLCPKFSLSFSGISVFCIWSPLLGSFSSSTIIFLVLLG